MLLSVECGSSSNSSCPSPYSVYRYQQIFLRTADDVNMGRVFLLRSTLTSIFSDLERWKLLESRIILGGIPGSHPDEIEQFLSLQRLLAAGGSSRRVSKELQGTTLLQLVIN